MNKTVLPSECNYYLPEGTILSPTLASTQFYTIGNSALNIGFSDFKYSISCIDTVWVYESTLSNGTVLPSFISFS